MTGLVVLGALLAATGAYLWVAHKDGKIRSAIADGVTTRKES